MPALLVAEARFREPVGTVAANDSRRTTFTVQSGGFLYAVSGGDLSVLASWPVEPGSSASHASWPDREFALESGVRSVVLRHRNGRPAWTLPHVPWAGDFESGCTWFDHLGRPFAVIPGADYEGCVVVALSRAAGQVVADAVITASPSAIVALHQRDGWVGLSVAEGQDAARAWWVRLADDVPPGPAGPPTLQVIDAGWDDAVLTDVDPSGKLVVTAPLGTGPLVVWTFPELAPSPAGGHAQPGHLLEPERVLRRHPAGGPPVGSTRRHRRRPPGREAGGARRGRRAAGAGGQAHVAHGRAGPHPALAARNASDLSHRPESRSAGPYCTPNSRSTGSMAK